MRRDTDLLRLTAPGLFVQKLSQAVGQSQQALGQGTVSERLVSVETVLQRLRLGVHFPWKPLGPDAVEERHEVVSPGNYRGGKNLEQEVCGLERERKEKQGNRLTAVSSGKIIFL